MINNIVLICLAVLSLLVGFMSFLVNNQRKKNEQLQQELQQTKRTIDSLQAEAKTQETINKVYNEAKKENEQALQDSASPQLDGFNAGLDLLRKLSEKRK